MQVKDVCRPLASDLDTRTARQMLDKRVQSESRIRSVLRLMSRRPPCAVEVKPDVVTRVTSRWHMHVTAAQPVRCHIQTWQHLHPLRLSPHLAEYEVCVAILQIVINKCVHHVLLSLFFPLPLFLHPSLSTHTCRLFNTHSHPLFFFSPPPPSTFSLFSPRPGTACRTQEDKVVSISSFCVLSLL